MNALGPRASSPAATALPGLPAQPPAPGSPGCQPEANHPGTQPGDRAASLHVKEFPARRVQVREARRFLADLLDGCPVADDAILVLSELAANSAIHSASQQPGGTFTVIAEIRPGQHVRIEVRDDGGPWHHPDHKDRPHGRDIIARLATSHGVSGDPLTGWTTWAVIDWHGADSQAQPSRTGRPR